MVWIEVAAELQCKAADQIQMLTKRTDPAGTMIELVRGTPRLRPDRNCHRRGSRRLGVGSEGLEYRPPGGLATLHANSAAEGLCELEGLIGGPTQRIPRRAIDQTIDLVTHIARAPGGGRTSELMGVIGWGRAATSCSPPRLSSRSERPQSGGRSESPPARLG